MLNVGDAAPDFSMQVKEGEIVNLSTYKGKYLILFFYPKDDTPGCTLEAKEFNDLKKDFEQEDAVIIGVSKDNLDSHDKFKVKYWLEFNLAVDDSGVAEKYGAFGEKNMYGKKYFGIIRTTFLIDKEGKIAHIWPKVSPAGHAREVIDIIKSRK